MCSNLHKEVQLLLLIGILHWISIHLYFQLYIAMFIYYTMNFVYTICLSLDAGTRKGLGPIWLMPFNNMLDVRYKHVHVQATQARATQAQAVHMIHCHQLEPASY